MVRHSCLMLLLVMGALTIFVHAISYNKATSANQGVKIVRKIPLQIGGWYGTDYPLDPIVYDILETKSILHRSYRNSHGQKVFLSLVYYEETKVDFHAPEGCLAAKLGEKLKKSPIIIKLKNGINNRALEVNQLIQKQDDGSDVLVYYFYKTGSFVGRSYIKLRLHLILNKFNNAKKSGSLIRVSTELSISDNGRTSRKELENFINSLFPYLLEYL